MSSDNKPLIAVVGALSKQGRSVTRSLLQSQRYREQGEKLDLTLYS